jgi:hypothetical protein
VRDHIRRDLLGAARSAHNLRAFAYEGSGNRGAHSARGARDDCGLAGQRGHEGPETKKRQRFRQAGRLVDSSGSGFGKRVDWSIQTDARMKRAS